MIYSLLLKFPLSYLYPFCISSYFTIFFILCIKEKPLLFLVTNTTEIAVLPITKNVANKVVFVILYMQYAIILDIAKTIILFIGTIFFTPCNV